MKLSLICYVVFYSNGTHKLVAVECGDKHVQPPKGLFGDLIGKSRDWNKNKTGRKKIILIVKSKKKPVSFSVWNQKNLKNKKMYAEEES